MFKLTYEVFGNPDFNTAVKKLARHDGFKNFKTTYNIARMVKDIDKEAVMYNELQRKMLNKYGTPNEDKVSFSIKKENVEDFNKENKEFLSTEFELERHKVETAELGSVALTPNEVTAIEPLLNIIEGV